MISNSERIVREFLLGFVKIHILHHAAHEEIYGIAMMEELKRHGYDIGPGTMYPVLHSLEKGGYLERHDRVVGGKVRKYYTITPAGREALLHIKAKIGELVLEVMEDTSSGETNVESEES